MGGVPLGPYFIREEETGVPSPLSSNILPCLESLSACEFSCVLGVFAEIKQKREA